MYEPPDSRATIQALAAASELLVEVVVVDVDDDVVDVVVRVVVD